MARPALLVVRDDVPTFWFFPGLNDAFSALLGVGDLLVATGVEAMDRDVKLNVEVISPRHGRGWIYRHHLRHVQIVSPTG